MVNTLPCLHDTRLYRFLCLLVLCALSSYAVFAQPYVGLTGGAGLSSQIGLRVGITTEWALNRGNLSLQSEWVYLQRNSKELVRKLPDDRRYWLVTIDYVSAPLLFKAKLDWEPVALYAVAGPEISYAVGVQANYDEAGGIFREKLSFDQLDLNRWDVGLCLGIGVEKIIRNRKKIFLDYRYYLGLRDLDNTSGNDIFHEGKVLTMGFVFPL